MKNLFLVVFVTLCFCANVLAQQNPVSKIRVKVNEDQDQVSIFYDLKRIASVPFYNIQISIKMDDVDVLAKSLSGDIGPQVSAGISKRIIWNALDDVGELAGALRVEVKTNTVITRPCMPINPMRATAGLSTVQATGLGLIVGGLALKKDANEFYDVYKNELDPNSNAYTDLTRDEHYESANSKNRTSQILIYGGAATMVVGGYIFIDRLIKIKRFNRRCANQSRGIGAAPKMEMQPYFNTAISSNVGVSLVYNF